MELTQEEKNKIFLEEKARMEARKKLNSKSVAVAIILSVLFGPCGLFYCSTSAAWIMIGISVILCVLTFGLSVIITYPISIILSIILTNDYNKNIYK